MFSWFSYLRKGLARRLPEDGIAGQAGYAGTRANMQNLRPFVARHWRQGALGGVLVLLNSLLGFPDPLILRYLIDDVILASRIDRLVLAIALLAVVQVATVLSNALQQFYFARFEQSILLDIQGALLDRTLRFPKSFFDDRQTGYLMSRLLSDVQGLRWFFSSTLVVIASSVLRFVGGVGLLFYLEWRLGLVVLVVFPGLVLCVRFFTGKLRILSHQQMEWQANVTRSVQESLSASLLVKAFSGEKRTVSRLVDQLHAARQIAIEQVTVSSLANLVLDLMPSITRAAVLVAGAVWVIRGEWTLGSLFAFQAYVEYVYGPALFLANANLQVQDALAALERTSALFDIVPEENLGTGLPAERLAGDVEFKNVSFSYDGKEPVVQDVSFHIRPGERVAIVGPSGVGKTTLLSLLLCFYRPGEGEIRFDGVPASRYELGSLRRRIGYVPQTTLLVTGTIMENLRYGNPDAGEPEVVQAARAAGIHDFIVSLPGGYQAPVGERGVNFSEGQKQRLALARALVKCPDILVLDEPTSALDRLIEKSILDALPELLPGKTLIVVAHRLSTSQRADRILLLNEKRLVATGTHRELLEKEELYRALMTTQPVASPALAT